MVTRFLAVTVLLLGATATLADEAEDRAVAAVKKLGGEVFRDMKAPGKPVVGVSLYSTKVKGADLKELAALKGLQRLDLTFTKLTDAGLKGLARHKELTSLSLVGCKVTDAGLKELAALKQLKLLRLSSTKVTDKGVKELQKALPKCEIMR